MKKLFTLLTLLVAIVTGAWGETVTLFDANDAGWSADGVNLTSGSTTVGNATWYGGGSASIDGGKTVNNVVWNKRLKYGGGSTFKSDSDYARVLSVTVASTGILKVYFLSGSSGKTRSVYVSSAPSSTNRDTGTAIFSGSDDGNNGSVASGEVTAGTYYIWCAENIGIMGVTFESSTDPSIAASNATITATESGVEATHDITVTGANLTGSTLTSTLNPLVPGLSVTLDETTITAGAISTNATLHYTATKNTSGYTTLTLSDGTTSKDVTVTYKAKVTAYTQTDVTTATTWDFSKTGATVSEIGLVDDQNRTDVLVANVDGYDIYDGFDSQSLVVNGDRLLYNSNCCQISAIKFHTTVPGIIDVTFSNTGGSPDSPREPRYLTINEVKQEANTTSTTKVEGKGYVVPAGNVVIGCLLDNTSTFIRVYKIVFTPTPEPATPTTEGNVTYLTTTDNMAGWRAFYDADNSYSVDENTTVYVAASEPENGTISLTSIEGIPAGVPVILHTSSTAESHKMTLTKANVAAYEGTNLLSWVTNEVSNVYRLGFNENDGVGFYPYSGTPASGAVILNTSGGAKALTFVFSDPTGISSVSAKKAVSTGKRYNLAGQLVGEGYKGIVIVNGKKVIK